MITLDEMAVIGVVIGVAVVPAIAMWWWCADRLNVGVQSGGNDDDAATQMFLRVLRTAEKTLHVHDDGDKGNGSIYDDDDVVQAVRRQLEDRPELQIRCLFNDKADLKLVRELRAEYPDRFTVYYLSGPRPIGDVHYKIADGGVMGYLSSHEHGQPERNFKLLDCSAAKPRTRKKAFGKYLEQFDRSIPQEAATA